MNQDQKLVFATNNLNKLKGDESITSEGNRVAFPCRHWLYAKTFLKLQTP